MSQCKANWFRACKFRPRYDEGAGSLPDADSYMNYNAVQLIEASKTKIYVRDVCERCGKTIENSNRELEDRKRSEKDDA